MVIMKQMRKKKKRKKNKDVMWMQYKLGSFQSHNSTQSSTMAYSQADTETVEMSPCIVGTLLRYWGGKIF